MAFFGFMKPSSLPAIATKNRRIGRGFRISLVMAIPAAAAVLLAAPPASEARRSAGEGRPASAERAAPAANGKEAPLQNRRISFSTLGKWDYHPEKASPVPESVKTLDNLSVELSGYMFPLESGARIRSFCLLNTSQTCCFVDMPWYNQYVLVEMEQPVPLTAGRPITVTGVFHIDPRPDEGYIYLLNGKSLTPYAAPAF